MEIKMEIPNLHIQKIWEHVSGVRTDILAIVAVIVLVIAFFIGMTTGIVVLAVFIVGAALIATVKKSHESSHSHKTQEDFGYTPSPRETLGDMAPGKNTCAPFGYTPVIPPKIPCAPEHPCDMDPNYVSNAVYSQPRILPPVELHESPFSLSHLEPRLENSDGTAYNVYSGFSQGISPIRPLRDEKCHMREKSEPNIRFTFGSAGTPINVEKVTRNSAGIDQSSYTSLNDAKQAAHTQFYNDTGQQRSYVAQVLEHRMAPILEQRRMAPTRSLSSVARF